MFSFYDNSLPKKLKRYISQSDKTINTAINVNLKNPREFPILCEYRHYKRYDCEILLNIYFKHLTYYMCLLMSGHCMSAVFLPSVFQSFFLHFRFNTCNYQFHIRIVLRDVCCLTFWWMQISMNAK